jgi:hypothetical protein
MYFPSYRETELLANIVKRRHRLFLLELAKVVCRDVLARPLHAETGSEPDQVSPVESTEHVTLLQGTHARH